MALTEGASSPDTFRKWSGIGLVAGALERRVWAKYTARQTFPNLYILLVASPGVGKQVIDIARELWFETLEPGSKAQAFHVSPNQMTKATLVDWLAKAKSIKLPKFGPPILYHSLLIGAEEFQVLLPNYDQEYIATLNQIFNNPELPYTESRRTGTVKEISIELPQINILAGVQPSYFVSTFPEEAWTTGFARRIIMIYAHEGPFQEAFQIIEEDKVLRKEITSQLAQMSLLFGQCKWEPEAAERFANWHRLKGPPRPKHTKLAHYNNSRTMFIAKLSIVSAVSRANELVIREVDVNRSLEWLLEAERVMPDIFREMIGRSDSQVIEEMYLYLLAMYNKEKQKAITGDKLRQFLLQRVPHDKVEGLLQAADKANIIGRVAGSEDLWIPKPKYVHEVD